MLLEKQYYQSATTQSESFHDKPVRCFRSHRFWIHLNMFWEQTNQAFLGIGHMVQICFCLFGKRRQQLPGSQFFFCNSMKLKLLLCCCYHLGLLNCSSSICDCKSPGSIHGCKCPVLQTSKQLCLLLFGGLLLGLELPYNLYLGETHTVGGGFLPGNGQKSCSSKKRNLRLKKNRFVERKEILHS